MKRIRKLVFGMIFALLTLIVCVYAYALFNRLPLDEQREIAKQASEKGGIKAKEVTERAMKKREGKDDFPKPFDGETV